MRHLGHRPDPMHYKVSTPNMAIRLGNRTAARHARSLRQYGVAPFDQVDTSSCVGCSTNRGTHTTLAVKGIHIPFPSVRATYVGARARERAGRSYPLQDIGSFPTDAAMFLREFGLVSPDPCEDLDPTSPMFSPRAFKESICAEPDLELLAVASEFKVSGIWRAFDEPKDIPYRIRQAIDAGITPCAAVEVDAAFEQNTGEVMGALKGPSRGGHYICIDGYTMTASGMVVEYVNSWGTSWGDGGYGLGDEDFMGRMSDVLIMDVERAE